MAASAVTSGCCLLIFAVAHLLGFFSLTPMAGADHPTLHIVTVREIVPDESNHLARTHNAYLWWCTGGHPTIQLGPAAAHAECMASKVLLSTYQS